MPNRKLGRASDQRTAILRNMTTAFVINGKVETTVARAKEISAIVEKLISSAVKEKDNYTTKEIEVSAPKYAGRTGGYTRIIRTGARRGDASEMAILEFV